MKAVHSVALLALTVGTAHAAAPNPDRPSVADTPRLASAGTVEVEAGGQWSGGFHMPVLAKYAIGSAWEPRLGADLAQAREGAPDLYAGTKIRLFDRRSNALAVGLTSALPVGRNDAWWGTALVLVDLRGRSGVFATANSGLNLGGAGGHLVVTGIPAVALLGTSLGRSWRAWVEGAAVVGLTGNVSGQVVDTGLGWTLTDIAVVDASAGWDIPAHRPTAQLGVTVNLGRPGG